MSESTLDGVAESDRSNSRSESPDGEAEPFSLHLKIRLVPIKGMYRLLDLIMEQGNSGLGNSSRSWWFTLRSRHPHS
jgi:hypothetical protein